MDPGLQAFGVYMETMKRKDNAKMVAEMVDQCFDTCVYNFRTRQLDNKEKDCLYPCTDKYFRVASRVGKVMTEQTLLQHAQDVSLPAGPGASAVLAPPK